MEICMYMNIIINKDLDERIHMYKEEKYMYSEEEVRD